MNKIKFIALKIILLVGSGCNAQTNVNDKQEIFMLKEFYTSYSTVSLRIEDFKKIDSLQEMYCTSKLRKEAKKYLADGYDLLTDDWGISKESLTSLEITKDSTKESTYVVSYNVDSYPVAPDKPVKKHVKLYVTVVKEGENYKLDSIN
jgi:uncharacterized protein YcfL